MELNLSLNEAIKYHSESQKARVLTENWIENNLYCPHCGNINVKHFPNNKPVADFYCPICNCQYELKSKNGKIGGKINDGAYEKMITRITSNTNPDFLFMSYSMQNMAVEGLIFVPKYFFTPNIIEKRKPLSNTARRAGWIGCNILIDKIPEQGYIHIIKDGIIQQKQTVIEKIKKSSLLITHDINARGWILDILKCVNKINSQEFCLQDIYDFEAELALNHPNNNNIKPKIRQQLQLLRDKGFIEFLGNGRYIKLM